ncbi:MAG TPA: lipopolysaccharide heptosyltransferase I [Burkholderiales bacterium]|nr:lipopolysaccharide heptosyltransferase I [Burkholderiales bacterium]
MRTAESEAWVATFKFLSSDSPKIAADHSKWHSPTLKVLFVKTSSLGDVVHNCPAVSDVARKRPGVEIDWVVEEPFAAIASMHPSVRRVIPVRLRRWRGAWWRTTTWREIAAFRKSVAAERYDTVIDTQSLIKSALISACAIGERHGMDAASARESAAALFYQQRHAVPRSLHAVERNRRLAAAALGYELDLPLEYGLQPELAQAAESTYVVFLTMTSRADKLWPEERWIEVGRALGMRTVLPWGSDEERRRATRIASALTQAEVMPRMTLEQLARLFKRAWAVIGVDTGLTHLAAASGVRTVGIYCGSDPALTGLYGARRATNLGGLQAPPSAGDVLKALQ